MSYNTQKTTVNKDIIWSKTLKKLLRDVEMGVIGELDYYWDGKKVIKDRIIFDRQELINWFETINSKKEELKFIKNHEIELPTFDFINKLKALLFGRKNEI